MTPFPYHAMLILFVVLERVEPAAQWPQVWRQQRRKIPRESSRQWKS